MIRADGNNRSFHALKTTETCRDKLRKGIYRNYGIPPRRQSGDYRCRNREQEVIEEGDTNMALQYELMDMEQAVFEKSVGIMKLDYTVDVMAMMTQIRKEWNMCYPGEEW